MVDKKILSHGKNLNRIFIYFFLLSNLGGSDFGKPKNHPMRVSSHQPIIVNSGSHIKAIGTD